jgi:hypothetical protein
MLSSEQTVGLYNTICTYSGMLKMERQLSFQTFQTAGWIFGVEPRIPSPESRRKYSEINSCL